jgi:ectoine hydroxylase-related dioxygenase (phytanoyl-CoA dioxygenase family)
LLSLDDWLDEPCDLSGDAVARFRRGGYVRLDQVLPPGPLAEIGAEITRLTIALNEEHRPLQERDTYDRAFLQVMNLWRRSEAVRRFVFGKRLARLAADLLEVEGVRLYHDQSLYKEPSGGITPAHADQYYWPLSSDRTVTAWIPLQPVPMDMGPLGFFAGSQRFEMGRDLPISDDSERRIVAAMADQGFPFEVAPFALGDVSFHLGWSFHRAGANISDQPRSVMTVIYMDRDIRAIDPVNDHQKNDLATWMPRAIADEIVATPLNPILFERRG